MTRTNNMTARRIARPAIAVLIMLTLLTSGFGAARVAAAQAFSVIASPGIPGVATSYTLSVTLNGYIGGNTLVILQFDPNDQAGTAMYVPTSVDAATITIYSGSAPSTVANPSVSVHQLQFRTAVATDTHSVTISINQNAGLKPLTVGTHTVSVTVGAESLKATYDVQQSSSSSAPVTVSSITAGDTHLGVASSYKVLFSLTSTLFPSADTIYVKFPAAFAMPNTVDGSNFGLIQGARVVMTFAGNATIDGSTIALRIPPVSLQTGNYAYFDASAPLELRCGPYTGIRNPTQGGSYVFEVWTSRQMTHATYALTVGTGVSAVSLTVQPATAGAVADYSIGFTTSAGGSLAALTGNIQVAFPAGFVLPPSLPFGSVSVNGKTASSSVSGQNVSIVAPVAIAAGQAVKVLISRDAGIRNGSASSAGIQLAVSTASDPLPVQTNIVVIAASVVSNVSDTVTPAAKGTTASHVVAFTTGLGGALAAGDTISLVVPAGFTVPSVIDKTQVTIRTPATAAWGIQPASVAVNPSAQSIVLTLGSSVAAGATIAVSLPAVITNPATGGSFTVKVSTSRETTAVDSAAFTIYTNPVATLNVSPATADGKGGYYTSQPSFTLTVDGPTGTTLSAFYRIDATGAFLPYDVKASPTVKIPEGKHAVSYYSQDSLGNVEPTHSQQFLVDLTNPVITVASPVQGSVVVQSSANVTGKITALDPSGVALSVGGISTPVAADGSFSAVVSFKHEGVNPIDIIAVSPSGRTATLTLSVNYIARVTMSLVIGSSTVNLNNEFKTLEAAPFISRKGVTMVPLRFISEAFKAGVVWDPVFKSVTITLGGKILRIQVGFLTADVGGKSFALQDAPVIVNGRTFVPLRFITENFGAKVDWNGALRMVSIVYPKKP